jgi:quercetin dioxygenase-like cupin family protein
MLITRSHPQTAVGSNDWFTGTVWVDQIAVLGSPSGLRLHHVHFSPGARTHWHSHPLGQILHIREGVGLVRCKFGPVEEVRAGDVVCIEPGEWHWHGAGPRSFMSHLAAQEAAHDGAEAEWGEPVSGAEYPV